MFLTWDLGLGALSVVLCPLSFVFCLSTVLKSFHLVAVLIQGASASMFPTEGAGIAYFAEQRRGQCIAKSNLRHVAIAERLERTGFSSPIGSNVEESTTSGQTAFNGFLVTRKTQENHLLELLATQFHYLLYLGHVLVAES